MVWTPLQRCDQRLRGTRGPVNASSRAREIDRARESDTRGTRKCTCDGKFARSFLHDDEMAPSCIFFEKAKFERRSTAGQCFFLCN